MVSYANGSPLRHPTRVVLRGTKPQGADPGAAL